MSLTGTLGGSLPILAATLWFVLAFAVYRAGPGKRFNVLFFALYSLVALKSVAESVIGFMLHTPGFIVSAPWFPGLSWWFLITYVCLAGMLPLYVWFVSVFPRPHSVFARHPSALAALFVPPGVLSLLLILAVFQPGVVPLSFERLGNMYNVTALVYTGYALLVLVQGVRQAKDEVERHRTSLVMWAFAIITVPSWFVAGLQLAGSASQLDFLLFISPLIELVAASVIAFAILKYQLMGVELIAKATVKQSFTVGSLSVVFFVTKGTLEEVFEALFNSEANYLIAGVVAGVLFLPLEKLSRRVVEKFFPGVRETDDYLQRRKVEIYKEQLMVAMADGELKEKELKMLAMLRQNLGLSEADARRIEETANPYLSGVLRGTEAGDGAAGPGAAAAHDPSSK